MDAPTTMSPGVFAAVLAAAALHAGWNSFLKVKLEPFLAMTLITGAGGLVGVPLLIAFGFPRLEAWPWLMASVVIHLGYYFALSEAYRRADMGQIYPIARGALGLDDADRRQAPELRLVDEDVGPARDGEHARALLGRGPPVIGDLAVKRETAGADEGDVDAEAVERGDDVEADRRLLGGVDLAAEHVDARAGDAAEELRVRQAVGADGEVALAHQGARDLERGGARIEQHHHPVLDEVRRRPADRRLALGVLVRALVEGGFDDLAPRRAAMDDVEPAALGKRLEVAPDRLARDAESLRQLLDADDAGRGDPLQDLVMAAGGDRAGHRS